jgi:hypothetical protein
MFFAAQARWGTAREIVAAGGGPDTEVIDAADPDGGDPESDLPEVIELPEATHKGYLRLLELEIPCYVLSDGRRAIGRTSATEMLTGIKGGGGFEKYIGAMAPRPFIDVEHVASRIVPFRLREFEGLERNSRGLPANDLIDV